VAKLNTPNSISAGAPPDPAGERYPDIHVCLGGSISKEKNEEKRPPTAYTFKGKGREKEVEFPSSFVLYFDLTPS